MEEFEVSTDECEFMSGKFVSTTDKTYIWLPYIVIAFLFQWLGVRFSLNHKAVTAITQTSHDPTDPWLCSLPADPGLGLFIDSYLLLIFGGIPWQVYFQRVLSSKSAGNAQFLSICAAFGCLFMAVPAMLLGAIGKSAGTHFTASIRGYQYSFISILINWDSFISEIHFCIGDFVISNITKIISWILFVWKYLSWISYSKMLLDS